ncbi:unnamed protein product [Caretta caretta]
MSQAGTSPWLRGSSSRQRGIAMELYDIPLARRAGRAAVQTEPEHFLSEGEAPVLPAFKVQGQRERGRQKQRARQLRGCSPGQPQRKAASRAERGSCWRAGPGVGTPRRRSRRARAERHRNRWPVAAVPRRRRLF